MSAVSEAPTLYHIFYHVDGRRRLYQDGSGRIRTLYGMAHVAPVPPQYSGEAALHILRLTLYIPASDAHTTTLSH